MSLPRQKNSTYETAHLDERRRLKLISPTSIFSNQTAPWSFQRKNETFLFSLMGGLLGSLSLHGLTHFLTNQTLLAAFTLFSLYHLNLRFFFSLASNRKWKKPVSFFAFLLTAWGTSLFCYHFLFESHIRSVEPLLSPWLLSLFAVPIANQGSAYFLNQITKFYRLYKTRAIIVGITPTGMALFNQTRQSDFSEVEIFGFFDYRKEMQSSLPEKATFLQSLHELIKLIEQHSIDLVIVTLPMSQEERLIELMNLLADTTASVAFVPDIFHLDLMNSSIGELSGIPLITLRDTPFYGWKRWLKRFFDLSVGTLLLVALSPILITLSILIKFSSKGPIFYRQKRVGLGTKQLLIWKFRTMEEPLKNRKSNSNPILKVTGLGAWLRKTSLDELPQLINVIKGEMSLVGPRPFFWEQSEKYRGLVEGYNLRHKVKPGMTGWAQVNGLRGPILNTEQLEKRVELDLYYVKNWSLLFDCIIILKSIPKVLWGDKTAY